MRIKARLAYRTGVRTGASLLHLLARVSRASSTWKVDRPFQITVNLIYIQIDGTKYCFS